MTEVQQNIQKYLDAVMIIQGSLERAGIVARYALSHQIMQDLGAGGFLVDHHPEIVTQDSKSQHEVPYRGYKIYRDPKPVPPHIAGDWSFVHEDYDGSPDGNDTRCGTAHSIADAKMQIDEQIADREFVPGIRQLRNAALRVVRQHDRGLLSKIPHDSAANNALRNALSNSGATESTSK